MDDLNLVTVVEYRGFSIPVYLDHDGQSYYCELENEKVSFGLNNTDFINDIQFLIDEKLDVIYTFSELNSAQLRWFNNGLYRDIQLIYKDRIIYIWLTASDDISKVNIDRIITEAEQKLQRLLNFLH